MHNLDKLPFDVLFEVARYLSLEDVVALGCTSRQLRAGVKGQEVLARMVVQNNAPFARETLLTSSPSSSSSQASQNTTCTSPHPTRFRSALSSIHARRSAFATASPRSACVVDHAVSDFLYSEGVLCYVYSHQPGNAVKIRVLNLEEGGREVAVLDVAAIVRRVVESVAGEDDGIATEEGNRSSHWSRTGRAGREDMQDEEIGMDLAHWDLAHCAAANLGFDGPLLENDITSSPTTAEGRSRSASPCTPMEWSSFSSSSRGISSSTQPSYPTARVTLVHYSVSILSLYLNFSSSCSPPAQSGFPSLQQNPHHLVAIRLSNTAFPLGINTTTLHTQLRIFQLPHRSGGYGSDSNYDGGHYNSISNDSPATTSLSSEGESDGASRGLKLFVRNTATHYCFGTHTGRNEDGLRVWVVRSVSLENIKGNGMSHRAAHSQSAARCAESTTTREGNSRSHPDIATISLPQIASKTLGVDTCFFIRGEHFYGLTSSSNSVAALLAAPNNASAMPDRQLHNPYISTYTSVRFPLAAPTRDAVEVNARLFRRHLGFEGPINDVWTVLEAVVDERSGKLRVVEGRREWLRMSGKVGGSGQRSWYFGGLGFGGDGGSDGEEEGEGVDIGDEESQANTTTPSGSASVSAASLSPAANQPGSSGQPQQPSSQPPVSASGFRNPRENYDPFEGSPLDTFLPDLDLSSDSTPHKRPWQRQPACVHRECLHDASASTARAFTLSRTKHRAYNYSAAAFLDLVEDERCCAAGQRPCLRMRVGARRERARGQVGGAATATTAGEGVSGDGEMQRQEEQYVHGQVRMWPPMSSGSAVGARGGGCSEKLHAIMNAPLQPCHGQSSSAFGAGQAVDVVAVTDERSMVFLRRPKYGGGATARTGPLVLVSFDEGVAAQGLDGLSWRRERCCR